MSNAAQAMDQMYRYQRYIYDLTRKYYLFGRDRLIEQMPVAPGQHVLEVGCGTGRNLKMLLRKHPKAHFYGLDASQQMLDTAAAKLEKYHDRVVLQQGLAQELGAQQHFQHDQSFERIFFSYALSMIPPWRESIHAALDNLADDGALYIVDFADQGGWPAWFQKLIKWWLALFHVHFRPELLEYLKQLEQEGTITLTLESIGRDYAFLACVRKK